MAQNREMILANFQACTGLDDVGEAIFHLEEAQWDLLAAVNRVIPQEAQEIVPDAVAVPNHIPANNLIEEPMDEAGPINNPYHRFASSSPSMPPPFVEPARDFSTNNPFQRYVPSSPAFTPSSPSMPPPFVEPESARDFSVIRPPTRNLDLDMPDIMPSTSRGSANYYTIKVQFGTSESSYETSETCTVAHLKHLIYQRTNIPPKNQWLTGCRELQQVDDDSVSLKSLDVSKELKLRLEDSRSYRERHTTNKEEPETPNPLSRTYVLNVTHEKKNNLKKTYCLPFPGSHTVLQVKNDVYTFTDIPARHQIWSGWPHDTTDAIMLCEANLTLPEHSLTLTSTYDSAASSSASRSKASKFVVDQLNKNDESDASSEEFEDATESLPDDEDQEIFIDEMPSNKLRPLVPPDATDEMAGAINFGEEFTNRYGTAYPAFYPGSLDDAIKDSCLKPARDRKLLAMYIHNDKSVLANVFCTQLLGAESVRGVLSDSFVVWGWDITHPSNKTMFLNSVNRCLGNVAGQNIFCVPEDKYPILVILMRNRLNTEIFRIVHGNIGVSELLTCLLEASDVFSHQQSIDLKDEEERAAREMIKVEQDRAYQASLAMDRAKEESKKQQELLEEQERERSQREKEEQENMQEALRQQLENQLPPEPEQGSGDAIIKIRYKLPDGGTIDRRFLAKEKLKYLLDFLTVKGYPSENYKVLSAYPKRDLSPLDHQMSLAELKLSPQETLWVEER